MSLQKLAYETGVYGAYQAMGLVKLALGPRTLGRLQGTVGPLTKYKKFHEPIDAMRLNEGSMRIIKKLNTIGAAPATQANPRMARRYIDAGHAINDRFLNQMVAP